MFSLSSEDTFLLFFSSENQIYISSTVYDLTHEIQLECGHTEQKIQTAALSLSTQLCYGLGVTGVSLEDYEI